jgi:hypothetical protein
LSFFALFAPFAVKKTAAERMNGMIAESARTRREGRGATWIG